MGNGNKNGFGAETALKVGGHTYIYYALPATERAGAGKISRLPFSLKVMVENLLRHEDGVNVTHEDIAAVSASISEGPSDREIAFTPARVLMQDFTGVPAVVDLAAMRDAIRQFGGNPDRINPLQTVDLVIDHSVQVDEYGTPGAFAGNVTREYERNQERYLFLKWGQKAFHNFRVVPPGTGIVHQVNLEYLADVVYTREKDGKVFAFPDTVVGTDSHTTMINGIGVVGWGVGGIEAEAAMLGQPVAMLIPEVVGFRLSGTLPAGSTATDLVLTVTQMLRKHGVVGKFVEFYGPGLDALSLADRATIANMAPEYGATIGFFPIDARTLEYMWLSGRDEHAVALTEAYARAQGLFRDADTPDPVFRDTLALNLDSVEPSLAGPRRPQDRVTLGQTKRSFRQELSVMAKDENADPVAVTTWIEGDGQTAPGTLGKKVSVATTDAVFDLAHGSVVIAAITSCTNTSNPAVLVAAGLLAKKAVERGLTTCPWVKTSLAPGSQVVTEYLKDTGLLSYLEQLRFHVVGYGCTTCIGNSGPVPEPIADAIRKEKLVAAAVLSGNRNFEGRVNPVVRANYLASPPLVVAYALAGRIDIDLTTEPMGVDRTGRPVYLKDIWPSETEIRDAVSRSVRRDMFRRIYADVFRGDDRWAALDAPSGELYAWDDVSTYVKLPPYFEGMSAEPPPLRDLHGARVLAVLGDSVTTDHISPAGSIQPDGPAGKYLIANGVSPKEFNSYGARRGNHEVMVRGTFANIRLRNFMAPGTEGGWTKKAPDGETMSIYDAAMVYRAQGTPLVVIAGKEYGSGSSRDWAAKGPNLLGVKAAIAETYERIHRSNLIGMGILPLQFKDGQNRETLGLTGFETLDIAGIENGLSPRQDTTVQATRPNGTTFSFTATIRIDTPIEVEYYRHGGILQYVLRGMIGR
ncbi:MAG: aconitate hydratase AcnA [candidate division Zixibacteria bacterium]|nr:aconitate hydratase AcnA [candidate division Zixibacteria bacterium]